MGTMRDRVEDGNGNICQIAYFGSREAAQAALDSLVECRNCINCSHCSYCSGCVGCVNCSYCSRCWRCTDCADLAGYIERANYASSTLIVPTVDGIHGKVLEAVSAPGALDMADWHPCTTTHCRAGWVVHLAGEMGYALERYHNTELAAMLIYRESAPDMPVSPVRFYDDGVAALADIRRMAALEARH